MTKKEKQVLIDGLRKLSADAAEIAALLESERIARDPSVKGYTDLDEFFEDLKHGKD